MNVTILRFFSLVADVLLRLRHERGVSQVAIASRAGLTDTQVSKYERGQVMPDVSTLLQLLHAFGQHLVVMPAPIAETLPERDAVVAAASFWFAKSLTGTQAEGVEADARLARAVEQLVAAEMRHGRHEQLVEPKAADR